MQEPDQSVLMLHSGRKYDIWPKIGPLDPGKTPEAYIDHPTQLGHIF